MNEENNFSATLKRITGSLRGRILITTAAIGIILLVTSIVVHVLQIQAEQDFWLRRTLRREAIQAYIKAGRNITSYSEFDYIRH